VFASNGPTAATNPSISKSWTTTIDQAR
jgi:hypothetical protein